MRRPATHSLALTLATLFLAVAPAAASADSIAYVKDNDVWVSSPDGARSAQVTHGRKFASPSQADDGTIVAIGDDNELWRFAQDGSQPSRPFLTWLGLGGGSGFSGPYAARVSPDGSKVAFTFFHVEGVDQVTGTSTTQGGVSYTAADHQSGERELGVVKGWDNPSWIDNAHVMAFDPGAGSLGLDGVSDVVFHALGQADPAAADDMAHVYRWFSNPDAAYPQFGAMSRRGDRLAIGEGGFVTTESLRIYTVPATPPAPAAQTTPPQLACRLQDDEHGYQNVSWSPDGSRLAYESGGSIYTLAVGDLSAGCAAVGAPADVRPAAPSGGGKPPRSAARCTVPRLTGRSLRRARALAARAHCALRTPGRPRSSGIVRTQRPRAGAALPAGGRVTVTLRRAGGRR
jgi:hypothetical protein